MRKLRVRKSRNESVNRIVDKLFNEDDPRDDPSYMSAGKEFNLSSLSDLYGFDYISSAYDGDIDDLSEHSYGHTYYLEGDKLFVIYSNFGASNKKGGDNTIGDGKGEAISMELNTIIRSYAKDHINSGFPGRQLRAFDYVNSSDLIKEATKAMWIVHVDQNGKILN